MMTRGRGGDSIPPKSDDVIYEQPLSQSLPYPLIKILFSDPIGGIHRGLANIKEQERTLLYLSNMAFAFAIIVVIRWTELTLSNLLFCRDQILLNFNRSEKI